ncbi:BPL-N domain-containing protein [Fodinicola feengrottensis]|uniref:BPL-N domain-containing protein n=1 Tax=Fodinicola feengrottensis TaxID=435914 RepID=UPI002442C16D|nr:BPL-N domain-containing protein [Fodinicola feengrottensis]
MSAQPFDAARRALSNLFGSSSDESREQPVALVYRGPASLPGCPEAVHSLLASCPYQFRIRYVGPKDHELTADALSGARLYAQPGGGTLKRAYKHLREHRSHIRDFVRGGGGYLGFCLGGYLAGATPGFDLLPGDTDQYIETDDATIDFDGNTVVDVLWRNEKSAVLSGRPAFRHQATVGDCPCHVPERHGRRVRDAVRRRSRRSCRTTSGGHSRLVHRRGPAGPPATRPGPRAGPGFHGDEPMTASVRTKSRLLGVDAARGIALLGMMAVHSLYESNADGSPTASFAIFGGRAAATFAVLAGVGIAFMTGRRRVQFRSGLPVITGLAVRALAIGAIGLFMGYADAKLAAVILPYYAVLFSPRDPTGFPARLADRRDRCGGRRRRPHPHASMAAASSGAYPGQPRIH